MTPIEPIGPRCPYCGTSDPTPAQLERELSRILGLHRRRHLGVNRFDCLCGAGEFSDQGGQERHVARVVAYLLGRDGNTTLSDHVCADVDAEAELRTAKEWIVRVASALDMAGLGNGRFLIATADDVVEYIRQLEAKLARLEARELDREAGGRQ